MKNCPTLTATVLSTLFLLSACTTTPQLEAVTDHDSEYDFSAVRKVAIQPVDRMNAAAVLISDMSVNRMNVVIQNELESKGIEVVKNNADADMYLTWHLVTEEKTDVRSYNSVSYYNCWRCGPAVSDITVRQYTQGTLIVDMIDPNKTQSVWRSMVQSRLNSKPDVEGGESLRLEAGRALFAAFPPQ